MADFPVNLSDTVTTSDTLEYVGPSGLLMRFRIGGISAPLGMPFDIEQPIQGRTMSLRFDITGPVGVAMSLPFDIDGPMHSALAMPFDVIAAIEAPRLGIWYSGGSSSHGHGLTPDGFSVGIHVFTKGGAPLGVITDYELVDHPSFMISDSGSMEFFVPRTSPDAALLVPDRLIAVGLEIGGELWAGSMEIEDNGGAQIKVNAPDVSVLLTGAPVVIEETFPNRPEAWTVYQKIIDVANERKATDNELIWDFAHNGTNPFYGNLNIDSDAFEAMRDVATRSNTEFLWRARIEDEQLRVTLEVADEFSEAADTEFVDGEGGNIVAGVRWTEDATTIRNGLRLSGIASNIAEYLPEWAQWAVEETSPSVEVFVDPGIYRRRVERDISADFGFEQDVIKGIADAILAQLWQWYYQFLYAWHDQFGRPFHEGYRYVGPPSDVEPTLHTGLGWRTWLRSVEVSGQPGSAVMKSIPEAQVLAVIYNRVTAVQTVRRYWFSEAAGTLYVTKMSIHGKAEFFEAEGGVLSVRHYSDFDHSMALVTSYAVQMPYETVDTNGVHHVTYRTVRRVVSLLEDGSITEGMWFTMQTPSGPTTDGGVVYTRPTIGDAPYLTLSLVAVPAPVELDSAFISKIYDFERYRIKDWDPRRDGIGAFFSKRTIVNNAPSTIARWHIVPFGVGVAGTTSLTAGITAAATEIYVDTIFSLPFLGPDWDGYIQVDEEPGHEVMLVTAILGNRLTVVRGQQGTEAIIHEGGAPVRALNVDNTSVFAHLWANLDWSEGQEWAEMLLARLSQPKLTPQFHIANVDNVWASVKLGSVHAASILTEGETGLTGSIRVTGYAPDPSTGSMEIIGEWLP